MKHSDLISREALIKAMSIHFYTSPYFKHIIDIIENAPTVPNEYMRGYEAAEREYKRPISCFNCKYDYKSAADEPCKYCEKHCKWQAKGEEK